MLPGLTVLLAALASRLSTGCRLLTAGFGFPTRLLRRGHHGILLKGLLVLDELGEVVLSLFERGELLLGLFQTGHALTDLLVRKGEGVECRLLSRRGVLGVLSVAERLFRLVHLVSGFVEGLGGVWSERRRLLLEVTGFAFQRRFPWGGCLQRRRGLGRRRFPFEGFLLFGQFLKAKKEKL